MRTLIDGKTLVGDATSVVKITISTHCPGKWAFVDLETGEVWERKANRFAQMKDKSKLRCLNVVALNRILECES